MKILRPLAVLISAKFFFFTLILTVALLRPDFFHMENFLHNFHWPENQPLSLKSYFIAWDASHYLFLADKGYQSHHMASNFFPLWPFLIYLGKFIFFGNTLLSAIFLCNLFSSIGFLLLYSFSKKQYGQTVAENSLLLFLIFPGAIFYLFPYAESLFLMLSVAFFIFLFKKRYTLAAFLAFLMVLSRPVGLFVFLPIFYELIQILKSNQKRSLGVWLLFLSVPIGLVIYFTWMWKTTGNALAYLEVQSMYVGDRSLRHILDWQGTLKAYLNLKQFHGEYDSFLDRFFFTIFLFMLPAIWRLDKRFFWYTLPLGVLPAVTGGSFMSLSRCISIIFPLFIVLGEKFSHIKISFIKKLIITVLSFCFVLFLFCHSNFYWVG